MTRTALIPLVAWVLAGGSAFADPPTADPPTAPATPPAAPAPAQQPPPQHSSDKVAQFLSGPGNLLYLGLSVGLPLATDGPKADDHAIRALDSVGSSVLVAEGLKALTHEKRPDSEAHDSFPSGHATAAFAVATAESALHPNAAPLWFLGATAIGYSRVRLHRHTLTDVIAGALLGYGVTRLELSAPRGFLVAPFVKNHQNQITGFSFSIGF